MHTVVKKMYKHMFIMCMLKLTIGNSQTYASISSPEQESESHSKSSSSKSHSSSKQLLLFKRGSSPNAKKTIIALKVKSKICIILIEKKDFYT